MNESQISRNITITLLTNESEWTIMWILSIWNEHRNNAPLELGRIQHDVGNCNEELYIFNFTSSPKRWIYACKAKRDSSLGKLPQKHQFVIIPEHTGIVFINGTNIHTGLSAFFFKFYCSFLPNLILITR